MNYSDYEYTVSYRVDDEDGWIFTEDGADTYEEAMSIVLRRREQNEAYDGRYFSQFEINGKKVEG